MRKQTIVEIMHPDYRSLLQDFNKWRLTYQSGRRFINTYLKRYSKREDITEFKERKQMTYCPSFAKAALVDVKNSIYQRMADIKRIGGDDTYREAIEGEGKGVDLLGSSMNNFMGQFVLEELLPMKRVGIYVDMPALSGDTLAETAGARPYLYLYPAEDVRSWCTNVVQGQTVYTNVLLRDTIQRTDSETGLPIGTGYQYRRVWLTPDGVKVQFYSENGSVKDSEILLPNLSRLPFVVVEISSSLLQDISDYQIALLNLNSSDLSWLIKANFPFYVEQYEPRADSIYTDSRPVSGEPFPGTMGNDHKPFTPPDGANKKEVVTGTVGGRRYPKGFDRPAFIHPSPEPITAAMAKEQQLKSEIRQLLNLSLSSLQPMHASAESKQQDQGSLECGLSAIGLTMEYAEREIAKIWAMYMSEGDIASVNYPTKYALKSEADRRADATQLAELLATTPSITFKKEIGKKIACALLDNDVDDDVIEKIKTEIDDAKYIEGDSISIVADVGAGLVSLETASLARGYSDAKNEVATAKDEHAARLKTIQAAQAPKPIQGVPDTNPNPGNPNKDASGNVLNPGSGPK